MALNPPSELRDVHGISEPEKELIKAFMQGAVYSWVKNRKNEAFAVRDLVGGENFEWDGTPLMVLYDKHINTGKGIPDSIDAAAKDLGWLVKTVLAHDKRTFIPSKAGLVNHYCWVGNEP
ncbi:MAG: hypothetical protein JWR26_3615 [Pedosphaera sp.]|nr:hypothetical protein [Pedosphaera sp.]